MLSGKIEAMHTEDDREHHKKMKYHAFKYIDQYALRFIDPHHDVELKQQNGDKPSQVK